MVASRLTGQSETSFRWTYVTNTPGVGADADAQDDDEELDANLPHHELLAREEEEGAIVASEIFEVDESDDEDPAVLPSPPVLIPTETFQMTMK